MKTLLLLIAFCLLGLAHTSDKCILDMPMIDEWKDIEDSCFKEISNQVQRELTASVTYLAMFAHFSQEDSYRPAVNKFFLNSANEERLHAQKMMEYMLMRGQALNTIKAMSIVPKNVKWNSLQDALNDALILEKDVTKNIKDIISVCEGNFKKSGSKPMNDYHAVDWFTSEFLEEQYSGLRQISGMLSTLTKMNQHSPILAELMFDRSLEKMAAGNSITQ